MFICKSFKYHHRLCEDHRLNILSYTDKSDAFNFIIAFPNKILHQTVELFD